jgi:eukaryotic-like serine/threonine-protein kinase
VTHGGDQGDIAHRGSNRPEGCPGYPRVVVTSRMTEQLGRVLGGRYRLTAPIGRGASAQVFLADDVTLRRRVAVKVLHPALADDEAFLRRFEAEARAAAALAHPNAMAVFDWGDDDGPYLVLELLAGGSLRAMLDSGARLSPAQALMVGLQAAQALDAAHRRGFVHRDIKPANLLFGEDGRLRIADFGLARALSEAAWTEPGDGLVGTARYAAPEQASGGRIDGKADVYALALVLIEAVTGTVPLTSDTTLGTLMGRVDTPVPVPEAVGPLRDVLERCGLPDPADRPTAADLGRSLLRVARQLDRPDPLPLAGAIDPAVRVTEDIDPTLLPPPASAGLADLAPGDTVWGDATTTVAIPGGDDEGATTAVAVPFRDADPAATAAVPAATATSTLDVQDDEEPPVRRRRWPWLVLALVLLIAAAAVATVAYLEAQPARAEVPSVSGLTEAEARAELTRAQAEADGDLSWELVVDAEHSERVSEGVVIRQDPGTGTELVDGGTVTIVISLGLPFRGVPDLEGLTEEEAAGRLADAELTLGSVEPVPHEDVEPGRVLDWRVGEEGRPADVRQGAAVDIVVSSGPAPRTVPALAGETLETARARLGELRLEVSVQEEFSNTVAAGRVVATSPGSGATVDRGATVSVRVSLGRDLVTVPDVSGLSLDPAIAQLEAAALEVGQVSGRARGRVGATDPEAGSRVDRGTVVDIVLDR